jgi:hypothetical protein
MDKPTYIVKRLDQASKFDFICPSCGYKRRIDMQKIRDLKKYRKVKLKCRCGHVQPYLFERRHQNRKAARLQGVIYHIGADGHYNSSDVEIFDVSSTGLCFKAAGNGGGEKSSPALGDMVRIKFKANDLASSIITKEAAIKNVCDHFYHVEFCDNPDAQDNLCFKILLYS